MNIQPIAFVQSGFKEKFGIPRQPGLVNTMQSRIVLEAAYSSPDAVRGLEGCSHVWLVFIFSECVDKGWKPTVRPPRLGGNERRGVFATRSPFRPNPIGLSAVTLDSIEITGQQVSLIVSGADLMDGTPIVDIKPYVPYSDCLPEAHFALAENYQPLTLAVSFAPEAQQQLNEIERTRALPLKAQITEILRCDPRPAYQRDPNRCYGIRLHDYNIRWSIDDITGIYVHTIDHCA